MAIKEEYVLMRQGKPMALFAGLLNLAHEKGLVSIQTELLQIPSPENGEVAVCKARVTMPEGRVFDGIGDASAANVGRNIAPHVIRMSETRAKARALRDATNVAEALADDPSDEEPPGEVTPTQRRGNPPVQAVPDHGAKPERLTTDQKKRLIELAEELEFDDDQLERAKGRWREFTPGDAQQAIDTLEKQAEEMANA